MSNQFEKIQSAGFTCLKETGKRVVLPGRELDTTKLGGDFRLSNDLTFLDENKLAVVVLVC